MSTGVYDVPELEYAAMGEAARASLRLLSVEFGLGEDATPARRISPSSARSRAGSVIVRGVKAGSPAAT